MAQAMNDEALASMNPATPFGPGFTAPSKGGANTSSKAVPKGKPMPPMRGKPKK